MNEVDLIAFRRSTESVSRDVGLMLPGIVNQKVDFSVNLSKITNSM